MSNLIVSQPSAVSDCQSVSFTESSVCIPHWNMHRSLLHCCDESAVKSCLPRLQSSLPLWPPCFAVALFFCPFACALLGDHWHWGHTLGRDPWSPEWRLLRTGLHVVPHDARGCPGHHRAPLPSRVPRMWFNHLGTLEGARNKCHCWESPIVLVNRFQVTHVCGLAGVTVTLWCQRGRACKGKAVQKAWACTFSTPCAFCS